MEGEMDFHYPKKGEIQWNRIPPFFMSTDEVPLVAYQRFDLWLYFW
jgi:hypothetical protein